MTTNFSVTFKDWPYWTPRRLMKCATSGVKLLTFAKMTSRRLQICLKLFCLAVKLAKCPAQARMLRQRIRQTILIGMRRIFMCLLITPVRQHGGGWPCHLGNMIIEYSLIDRIWPHIWHLIKSAVVLESEQELLADCKGGQSFNPRGWRQE